MKFTGPINRELTDILRPHVDVYYWRGIPVGRRWPDYVGPQMRRALARNTEKIKAAQQWYKRNPSIWKEQWKTVIMPIHRTSRDLINKISFRLSYEDYLVAPPATISTFAEHSAGETACQWTVFNDPLLNPANLVWRVYLSNTGPGAFKYSYRSLTRERTGFEKPDYVYDWFDWDTSIQPIYYPTTQTFVLGIPGYWDFVSVVPSPAKIQVQNFPLSIPTQFVIPAP